MRRKQQEFKLNFKPIITVVLLCLFSLLITAESALAADRMTYEDYQIQLQSYLDREQAARDAIAAEMQAIDDLRAKIVRIKAEIENTWNEIFATLGITREEYEAFLAAIGDLEEEANELARLAPSALLERAKELDELEVKVGEMLANPISKLSEPQNRLQRLAARVAGLKNALPKPKHDTYNVVRGDYLWKIAGKDHIYDDSWKWMRIYSANRTEINDPDLIFPDQRLRIPRQIGRDEHLVARGEYLAKIAGYPEVYGDPFKWTKIYQANKTGEFLADPNLIYPEQILVVPRD